MSVPIELEIFMKDFATQGLRGVQGSVEDIRTQTRQLIIALEEALKAQRKLYADNQGKGISTDADVKAIQALKAQIDGLKAGLDDLDKTKRQTAATPVVDEQVARSASNLKMQFQQVARELPSLAMGPQMFILAISNNLPMLADAIKNVREQNEQMRLSGQKGVPVWKQLAGALLSWQTALTVGITLLITYGDEIVKWIGNLFKGKDALNAAAIEQARLNKAMGEARKSAASQTAQLSLLYKMTQNSNASLRDRKAAVAELQRQYPAYFGNLSQEAILAGNAAGQYRQLANDILKAARARAYQKRIEKLAERNVDLQRYINADTNWTRRNRNRADEARAAIDLSEQSGQNAASSAMDMAAASAVAAAARSSGVVGEMDRRTEALKKHRAELKANEAAMETYSREVLKSQSALNKIDNGKDYVYTPPKATAGGTGGGTADVDSRAKAAADAEAKAAELIAEQQRKVYEEASEQGVEAMQDGTEKEIASVRQEGDKKRAAINEDAERTAEALAQAAYKQYLAQNPKTGTWKSWKQTALGKMTSADWVGAVTNPGADLSAFSGNAAMSSLLSHARQVYADRTTQQAQDEELQVAQVREKALKDMLGKYEDFEAQRQRIAKEGNDDIAQLEKMRTAENSDRIDRAIAEAKDKMQKAIQEVNDSEAAETTNDSPFLKSLFGDTSEMGFSALQKLIAQARELRKYLSGTGSREEAIKIIPADELARIEKSPAELDKLKKALDRLLKTDGEDKWVKRIEAMRKAIEDLGKAKDFKSAAAAIGSIAGAAEEAAKDIADMFEAAGNGSMADAMNTVGDVMGAVSNIGQAFAKGGMVGGVMAALGEVASFAGKAAAASARHKAALKEIMNEQIAQQRAYNLLLLEQNLLMKEATTIFGTDTYAKAANAVGVMKDAYEQLNEAIRGTAEQQDKFAWKTGDTIPDILGRWAYSAQKDAYSGLADISIVTGHKKTGLFGWGKGRDVYSSILDVYPELIDENGKFNYQLAETILNTRKMSDESKNSLQNMIDLAKQAEEAYNQLNDYFTSIFGELGSTLTDALVDAFANGTDAGKAFVDSVSDMLEVLAKQMIQSIAFAPLFKKAQEQMMGIAEKEGLTDEQRFGQYAGVIGALVSGLKDAIPEAEALVKLFQDMAAKEGIDIFKPDGTGSSQTGEAAAYTTMSQDQGRKLEGLFTSVQDHVSSIDKHVLSIVQSHASDTRLLAQIAENTSGCKYIQPILEQLQKMERDGIKVK